VDITTLASKIDIVLEVESLESYIKHLTSPMIMFEVSNVTKLP
jgi:transcription antitermination factor NusA-like protein